MKRGRLLSIGVVGVSLTVCGLASPTLGATPAVTKTTTTTLAQTVSSCSYPPVRTPALSLVSSVPSVKNGVSFTLSGTLKVNSCGLPLWLIGLYASSQPNGNYSLIATKLTTTTGAYSFTVSQTATRSYRTVSMAALSFNSAVSNTVTVTKK